MAKKTTAAKSGAKKKSTTTKKDSSKETKKKTTTAAAKKKTTAASNTKKRTSPKTTTKKNVSKTTNKTTPKKETTGSVKKSNTTTKTSTSRKKRKTRYTKKELEHFRKIINNKREEIIEQLQNLRERMLDTTTGEYINENSPYSLHMAEQGTDAQEREKTFLYAQRENKFLGYLEAALKRIDNGTYGICIECIDEPQNLCETCPLIPKERLEAVPHSQLCRQVKEKQEKNKLR
jgi:RNA polymerase-binding transcription factor DksA